MLKHEYRLQRKEDFDRVFKQGRPVFFPNIALRAVESRNQVPRFGFIISNKVEKLAVRRNGIKRQLRQIIQDILPQVLPGRDIVILVKQNFPYPYDQDKVRQQVVAGIKKLGLLKDV